MWCRRTFGPLAIPMAVTVLLYAAFQSACTMLLDVSLSPRALPADLALHLLMAGAVLAVSRSRRVFFTLIVLLEAFLHVGNALKVSILGAPIMPDDVLALRSLFMILSGWQFWLLVAVVVLAAIIAARGLTIRGRAARVVTAILVGLGATLVAAPGPVVERLDALAGNVEWNQPGNYAQRGPILHLVQEGARYLARSETAPSFDDVLEATRSLRHPLTPALAKAPPSAAEPAPAARPAARNVHMIVLESFWDPAVLTAAGFSEDPLAPEFRTLWRQGGSSRALVPVFGGYTANSEFEALCGFPVMRHAVFFEGRLRNDVPCLPQILGQAGYVTVASHPNAAAFWNRVNAYRRIGFEAYWSDADFVLDDMYGEFLSDASLYRQVLEKISPLIETGTPTFDYVLTFFGHLDFPMDDDRARPVRAVSADDLVERYANTVRQKSRDFVALVADLRTRDPDALIVAFGDHLPSLGPNFEAYVGSGLLAPDRAAFTDDDFRTMVATPLLVIDGRNGPVDVGTLALYQLPSLIRDLLGLTDLQPMDLTRTPPGVAIRPLPGLVLMVGDDGTARVCRTEDRSEECLVLGDWLRSVDMVGRDLFSGAQHGLGGDILPLDETPEPGPSTGTPAAATGT